MENLTIRDFKCFKDLDIKLKNITILTGTNGSGKSSVVQSVLILSESMNESLRRPGKYTVQLNDYHSLSLGTFDEICNIEAESIELSLDDSIRVILSHPDDEESAQIDPKAAIANVHISDTYNIPSWLLCRDILYLNAERCGPRRESDVDKGNISNAGDHGELSGNLLLEASYSYPKVAELKRIKTESTDNFNIHVDLWMSYICSDVAFKAEPITMEKCQVRLRQPRFTTAPPNTGFGFTYALPIVLDGLMAPKGSMMIVENPEAHLHPRAQSNMGFFLGQMAASGVRILVETHSEHVVNGIRRAALSQLGLSPNEISIYFFHDNEKPIEISVDSHGNLSEFPVDFFDQVRQDMIEIIRLGDKLNAK